ncbi:30S ribosomal protein S4 [Candidatus Peregrinibacteria bacterium]|nr:30S ribosomal protein S4 [Candidatus Peregrinibacteria bacterium]
MARYKGPKVRLARRDGISLAAFGNYEGSAMKAAQKKNYPPGMHGKKGTFAKPSEFGKQLREKQKAKRIYGILEKQFSNYYKKAIKTNEATDFVLIKMLEKRLDNVIYRAGLAETRRQARQIVTHGLVKLNGRRVDIPSIEVKVGDKLEIRDRSKKSPLFADIIQKKSKAPKWLSSEPNNLTCEVIKEPTRDDFEHVFDAQMIVEFYSK